MANKDKRNRKGYGVSMEILLDPWIFVPLIIVVFEVAMILFLRHKFVAGIEYDFWGIFGDFFGGVIGTILTFVSVVYVAKTFREQQKETKSQRFNTLFSELLGLYKDQVNGMKFDINGEEISGKNCFDKGKEEVKENFNELKYSKYGYRAKEKIAYMNFYENNKSKLGAYFRTLFRIFDLIENFKGIDNEQKREYSKIIRSQLSESELFFIRYNAMTVYSSKNTIKYINKYNILKHLPIFDLLKFEKECEKIGVKIENSKSINAIFYDIQKSLKQVFREDCKYGKEICIDMLIYAKKHRLLIKRNNEYEVEIKYLCNTSYKATVLPDFEFLDKMCNENKQRLLELFIDELFFDSNFSMFNNRGKVKVTSSTLFNGEEVTMTIKNTKSNPLKIKCSH